MFYLCFIYVLSMYYLCIMFKGVQKGYKRGTKGEELNLKELYLNSFKPKSTKNRLNI